ncbi:MAG: xanthine dehydrogenase family protein molybdopterin-binding subunit [Chloroflexota bacterium]|nr:xanthine dehydrogenase family protein molybdopterin-binding subunit [Chloroflexota bacterium]
MAVVTGRPKEGAATGFKSIGTSPVRHDGVDKVTGRACYGADVFPGNLAYGAMLRSPHAHARIVSIDFSEALSLPGVLAVASASDLPQIDDHLAELGEGIDARISYKSQNMLAREKVLYDGHAIAAVAATDPHTAELATRLINVEFELLPPLMSAAEAMAPGAPLIQPDVYTDHDGRQDEQPSNVAVHSLVGQGDPEAGFDAASLVLEREYSTATVHQGYIEPHNATARWLEDGQLEVWCSSQGAFAIRAELAELLDLSPARIRVHPMEIGGGFGGKLTSYLELPAALLARKCARPVKMTMSRSDVLRATGPTSASRTKVKVGVDDQGVITAARAEVVLESGMHPGSPLFQAMLMAFGPYWLENVEIEGWEVLVNKPHVHAYRAPGAPLTSFAVETLMNEIGDALGLDPLELRRRNAAVAGAWRADGTTLPISGNVECLDAIEQSDHWQSPLGEPSGPGKARGRGFASGMWRNNTFESSLDLRLHADGSVTLTEGSVDIGGSRTSIALQLAEVLGVDVSTIQPVVVDTDSVGFNHSTGGSRTTNVTGQAAILAGRNLVAEMRERLAELWGADPENVEFSDGVFSESDRRVEFADAAAQLAGGGQLPTATATVAPTVKAPSYAIHACDVEVDLETGKCDVLRWTVAQDAGRAIYPPYVEGQMQGAVAQGAGWALLEEYWYDDSGVMANDSLLDYRTPTALDLPLIEAIIVEVPNPAHPFGVRGVGEAPIVAAPAAAADAVARATGKRLRDLPISPPRVVSALRRPG